MSFFDELQLTTQADRAALLSTPLVRDALSGSITRAEYVAFLTQAYHHVRHTVPLLMAAGARLGDGNGWLREALAHYIDEELGHEEWILDDIEACGFSREKAAGSLPNAATELMVSYAYDTIYRVDPLGMLGMVHVLEGTSVRVADDAATSIQAALDLPDCAFHYLRSHGALDQDHVKYFAWLMNRLEGPDQRQRVTHAARMFYRLYRDVFLEVDGTQSNLIAA